MRALAFQSADDNKRSLLESHSYQSRARSKQAAVRVVDADRQGARRLWSLQSMCNVYS